MKTEVEEGEDIIIKINQVERIDLNPKHDLE